MKERHPKVLKVKPLRDMSSLLEAFLFGGGEAMRLRNIAFMTVVLVFILSSPAVSQQWVDIKNPKELRTLHSNKTFRTSYGVEHYRADGKGILIYSNEQRLPCTWEIQGKDQVCVTDERGKSCWQFRRSKKNPEEYVKTNPSNAYMVIFKVEDGIPQF